LFYPFVSGIKPNTSTQGKPAPSKKESILDFLSFQPPGNGCDQCQSWEGRFNEEHFHHSLLKKEHSTLQEQHNLLQQQVQIVKRDRKLLQQKLWNRERQAELILHQRAELEKKLNDCLEHGDDQNFIAEIARQVCSAKSENNTAILTAFFLNCSKNYQKDFRSRRHVRLLQDWCVQVRLMSGARLYSFIQANLAFLPSLSRIDRIISKSKFAFSEGLFESQLDQVFANIESRFREFDFTGFCVLAEDGTRILNSPEWNPRTNEIVGFVLGDDQAHPTFDSYENVATLFRESPRANTSYVYMLVPMSTDPRLKPTFVACLGTDNKFASNTVHSRWNRILNCASARNLRVLGHADGDPRLLKAMLQLSQADHDPVLHPDVPDFWLSPTKSRYSFQDPIHLILKVMNSLRDPKKLLTFGAHSITLQTLRDLFKRVGPVLCPFKESDLEKSDPQNFPAVYRILQDGVVDLLNQHFPQGSIALRKFLDIVSQTMVGLLDPDSEISILDRVRTLWRAVSFFRYSRAALLCQNLSVDAHSITKNAYLCLELWAHNIVSMILQLISEGDHDCEIFFSLLSSQACEKLFRACRSLFSSFSVVINFSLFEFMNRVSRLELDLSLRASGEAQGINYWTFRKDPSKIFPLGIETKGLTVAGLNAAAVISALKDGVQLAQVDVKELGVDAVLLKHDEFPTLSQTMMRKLLPRNFFDGSFLDELKDVFDEDSGIIDSHGVLDQLVEAPDQAVDEDFIKHFSDVAPEFLGKEEAEEAAQSPHAFASVKHEDTVRNVHKKTIMSLLSSKGAIHASDIAGRLARVRSSETVDNAESEMETISTYTWVALAFGDGADSNFLCRVGRILHIMHKGKALQKQYVSLSSDIFANCSILVQFFDLCEDQLSLSFCDQTDRSYYPLTIMVAHTIEIQEHPDETFSVSAEEYKRVHDAFAAFCNDQKIKKAKVLNQKAHKQLQSDASIAKALQQISSEILAPLPESKPSGPRQSSRTIKPVKFYDPLIKVSVL
jgi:hypothetical protein